MTNKPAIFSNQFLKKNSAVFFSFAAIFLKTFKIDIISRVY